MATIKKKIQLLLPESSKSPNDNGDGAQTVVCNDDQKKRLEAAVYVRTLKAIGAQLPQDSRQSLERTMYFRPLFFLERTLAVLQLTEGLPELKDDLGKLMEESYLACLQLLLEKASTRERRELLGELEEEGREMNNEK